MTVTIRPYESRDWADLCRIHDAATGLLESGEVDVAEMVSRQPWDGSLPFRVRSRTGSGAQ